MRRSLLVLLAVFLLEAHGQGFRNFGSIKIGEYNVPNTTIKKTYYLSEFFRADWTGSYNFCRANGLQLTMLDTTDEETKFRALIAKYITAGMRIYVGSVSAVDGDKTNWIWFKTGQKVSYSFPWNKKEPNGADYENCIGLEAIKKAGPLYSDIYCSGYMSYFYNFVCEEVTSKGKGLNQVVA